MELKQFNSFKELISAQLSDGENAEISQIIAEIYNTSYSNEVWIGLILDFLNDNNNEKYYSEYYLNPEGSFGTRKYTYRFISTEEDVPYSITDDDVSVLKRLKAQPQFILYDYEEELSSDMFSYLGYNKTLKKCLESIGMSKELKEYLCEYCFCKFKQKKRAASTKKLTPPKNIETN